MIRVDRASLLEAVFKLGACVESLTWEEKIFAAPDLAQLARSRVENVRKTLAEVAALLSKGPEEGLTKVRR